MTSAIEHLKAFDYLTKSFEMFKRVLPSEHAKIASTLIKIGYLFEKQSTYDRALDYYHHGHRIAAKVMSGEHPCLRKYFQRIIDLYKRINRIDDAIRFLNKKLISQRESLREIRPNIAQIYIFIGDLTDNIELKL
jgi:tetratricopeptide (TPR) repeat protein